MPYTYFLVLHFQLLNTNISHLRIGHVVDFIWVFQFFFRQFLRMFKKTTGKTKNINTTLNKVLCTQNFLPESKYAYKIRSTFSTLNCETTTKKTIVKLIQNLKSID